MDVDKIATKLGGGGHKKRAGFETDKSVDEVFEILKEYMKKYK